MALSEKEKYVRRKSGFFESNDKIDRYIRKSDVYKRQIVTVTELLDEHLDNLRLAKELSEHLNNCPKGTSWDDWTDIFLMQHKMGV